MARVSVVKKNGKPVAASVSTGNTRRPMRSRVRARAGLCPGVNAISQIASNNKKG